MHIVTVGDVMLDVLVDAPDGLRSDDDTEANIELAAGGQAANVAAWVASLGARATLVGPVSNSAAGHLIGEHLGGLGVDVVPVEVPKLGTVVSILSGGTRTLASDAGDQGWVDALDASVVPDGVDWLHVSAYPLLRAN